MILFGLVVNENQICFILFGRVMKRKRIIMGLQHLHQFPALSVLSPEFGHLEVFFLS